MSYIGQGLPADTFQGFVTDSFTGDGSATTFTLSKEPFSEDTLIVVINNVIQKPTTNFTVSGTTLTIVGTAVADGDVIYAIHMGGPLPIGGASELDLNGASDKLILDADADTTISADTDDQIDFKVGGSDVFHILGSKLIVADTASHTDDFLQIESPASGGGHGIQIRRNDTNTDQTVGRVQFGNNSDVDLGIVACKTDGANNTGAIVVSTASAGTTAERFRVTEAGIHIGGTADANALDDYEEGTWTVTLGNSDASEAMTLNGSFGGTAGTMHYTKIGQQVFVGGYIVATGNGTFDSNSAIYLNGLPFTVRNSNTAYTAVSIGYAQGLNITANQSIGGYSRINTTGAVLWRWDTATGGSSLNRDEFSEDGGFIFSISYFTDA